MSKTAFASFAADIAAAAEDNDMSQAQSGGGGEYTPPAAGPCFLRLVAYVETGRHRDEYKGEVKMKDKVQLIFEVLGKNYPPRVLEDGTSVPTRITVNETLSLNEKANFFKLFHRMRGERVDIKHMAQMLGEGFKGKIFHKKSKDGKRTYAQLRDPVAGDYHVFPPFRENDEGDLVRLKVPEAASELRLFLWSRATKQMWDSLFIDGEYPARKDEDGNELAPARSKNVFQERIREAVNFKGSPIASILEGADDLGDEEPEGKEPEDVVTETKPKKPAGKPKAQAKKEPEPEPEAEDDPFSAMEDDDIPY